MTFVDLCYFYPITVEHRNLPMMTDWNKNGSLLQENCNQNNTTCWRNCYHWHFVLEKFRG